MPSSHREANGAEPGYTNHAKTRNGEDFTGTLDYIFTSPEWKVVDAIKVKDLQEVGGGTAFPNEVEPSDHILLHADLELTSSSK